MSSPTFAPVYLPPAFYRPYKRSYKKRINTQVTRKSDGQQYIIKEIGHSPIQGWPLQDKYRLKPVDYIPHHKVKGVMVWVSYYKLRKDYV